MTFALLLLALLGGASPAETCDTVPSCIARVRAIAPPRRMSAPESTQLRAALVRLGPEAVPELIGLFRCGATYDAKVLEPTALILGGMGDRATGAVAPLARIALDDAASPIAREAAVEALGKMRHTARAAVPALLTSLEHGSAEWRGGVRLALVRIGGHGVAPALAAALEDDPREAIDLLGEIGHAEGVVEAAPAIESLLSARDRDVRLAAARVLGEIAWPGSAPTLSAALADPDDWRLVYVAATGLGRMRAASARAELQRVAASHWFRPVRAAAGDALAAIDGSPSRPSLDDLDFSAASRLGGGCDDPQRPPVVPEEGALDPGRLDLTAPLAYEREITGYGLDGVHVYHRRVLPQVGLRIGKAWLVGGNEGEWGGELMFLRDGGTPVRVLEANVTGIHRVGERIVVVAGLAHLNRSYGRLYSVACDERGCMGTRWKELPGAPENSRVVGTGDLLVSTQGGALLVSPDGRMQTAACNLP